MSPMLPPKPCAQPGCPALIPAGTARCPAHAKAPWARPYDRDIRPSAAQRGYGAAWATLRKVILARDGYLCISCAAEGRETTATQVDHVLAKHLGGSDDESNLRSVCRPCHDSKSGREGQQAGPTGRGRQSLGGQRL